MRIKGLASIKGSNLVSRQCVMPPEGWNRLIIGGEPITKSIPMLPGIPGGRASPRQAKMLMKQLGYKELEGVEEVVIRTADKEYVIKGAGVAEMNVQGQRIFQVVGQPEVTEREGAGPAIPEEDVNLVAERAGVSKAEARKALEECNGEPAEAIIKLMEK